MIGIPCAHGQVCPFLGHCSHFFLISSSFFLMVFPIQVTILGPLQDPGPALTLPFHLSVPFWLLVLVTLPHW